jgi:N-methylhydantoinase A
MVGAGGAWYGPHHHHGQAEVRQVGYTIDVDIGGTLTDGLFSDGRRAEMVKVDTTPHDVTVCFFECLNQGARRFGYEDLREFLERVDVVRWSSTIATNVLAERKGPRVGLLVNRAPAENLYGPAPSPAVGFLVAPQHIAVVATPVDRAEVLRATRALLERGVRRVCVSLAGAHADPTSERLARSWIEQQYPDHYLGSVPVLLGSDMVHHPDDRTRTHLALLNAYVHGPLASGLFKAEDEALQLRYRRPIYIGHVNGGVARIAKTKGVDTIESGPVFGLNASAYFARAYGLERVVSLDVGGTTSKVGLVEGGSVAVSDEGEVFGVGLRLPWMALHSLALGGGSVARLEAGGVALGPESMGAYPGPACYDLGSQRPTLTDALLVAGMLNPDRFLGGRRRLSVERARQALAREVATPLGVSVETAAWRVIDEAVARVVATATRFPSLGPGTALFAFGGNGANLAAAVAERLGCAPAVVFRLGPVFSAFGSSLSMVRHISESWPASSLEDPVARGRAAALLEEAHQRMRRDLAGEGFDPATARISAEVRLRDEWGERRVELDLTRPPAAELERLARGDGRGVVLERMALVGVCPVASYEPPRVDGERHRPTPIGRRSLHLATGEVDAELFDWDALTAGAVVVGPAVLEASANTCTVPPGWQLDLDGYGNGLLGPAEG